MKSIITIFILIISGQLLFSQQSESDIYLLSRSYQDAILIRWSPTDYATWNKINQAQVYLQRRMLGVAEFKTISKNLAVKSLEHITLNFDTDDPHVVAVAEALYGEAENLQPEKGPMGKAINQYNEQSQRFAIAAVNADLSEAAANILGWRYLDSDVRLGVPYEYRILIQPKETSSATSFYSQPLKAKANVDFQVPTIQGVLTKDLEHAIEISWPKEINEDYFTGYFIEKSTDDGKSFQRVNDYALIKDPSLNDEEHFKYIDRQEKNYQPVQFRIQGITPFAELSQASEVVSGQGIDLSAPQPPHQLEVKDLRNGQMRLQWKNNSKAPDHQGFIVARAGSMKGPFKPIHEGTLALNQLDFIDSAPLPYQTNYYAVYSIDDHDNTLRSPVAMGIWFDEKPPTQPVALTGKVDSTGHVFLMWEPGKERDLHGYRVFYSHAKNREFIQLNDEIIRQNYFFDTITTKTLTEHIHYKIVALDNNYNPSEYSEILTLQRPDKVAPNAPVIYEYNALGTGVMLRWNISSSMDVLVQELWQKGKEDIWKKVRELPKDVIEYLVNDLKKNENYEFKLIAVDDVGLKGESKNILINTGNYSEREGPGELTLNYDKESQLVKLVWQNTTPPNAELIIFKAQGDSPIRLYKKINTTNSNWEEKINPDKGMPLAFALQIKYADGTVSPLSNIVKTTQP